MKSITQLIILSTCLAISSIAWSIPLSGGGTALLAPTTLKNSGAASAIDWVEGVVGIALDEFSNSGSPDTHFLFDNEFDLHSSVVDMGFGNSSIYNIGKISHSGRNASICTAG